MDLEFLQTVDPQILVGVAVAVVAIAIGAIFLFSSKKPRGVLDPENFRDFKLVKRTQLSHNVAKFTFALPTPTSVLGLPIGQHISCRGKDSQGEEVIKPYTPTTLDSDVGSFELVIKMYPQGRMSHHFREMRVGESLAVKGPKVQVLSILQGCCLLGVLDTNLAKLELLECLLVALALHQCSKYALKLNFSAVARAILENPKDQTKVHLIYANVTHDDILLKEELEGLASRYPDSFKIYYVLNQPPEVWNGGVGFVSKEMIQTHLPAPAADIQILRCGPPPMNKAMAAHLEAIGYTPEMQFQF
ncbi:unnamed protein product [Linum tenue]|uniref:cytochrome-b5 reductase n=1 Tax=Linum tenue TaxID=586396 RepID=A0AAV0HIE6_9ROSI|nr:unnamed protein product [Linum tenue]